MDFEYISITGFTGDRTPHAAKECPLFARALSGHLNIPCETIGEAHPPQDLPWEQVLIQSSPVFQLAAKNIRDVIRYLSLLKVCCKPIKAKPEHYDPDKHKK